MEEKLSLLDEITKTVGLPKKIVDEAVEFLGSLIKDPLKEASNIIYDDIRYLRVKNQVRLLCKAKAYFEKQGLQPNKIPTKVIVPLLEHGSLEDDMDLQERWANLLINSAIPETKNDFFASYIEILKQISPEEALILDFLYDYYFDNKFSIYYTQEKYESIKGYKVDHFILYIDNLFRLNIIKSCLSEDINDELSSEMTFRGTWGSDTQLYPYNLWNVNTDTTKFTTLGLDFIRSCRINKNPKRID